MSYSYSLKVLCIVSLYDIKARTPCEGLFGVESVEKTDQRSMGPIIMMSDVSLERTKTGCCSVSSTL